MIRQVNNYWYWGNPYTHGEIIITHGSESVSDWDVHEMYPLPDFPVSDKPSETCTINTTTGLDLSGGGVNAITMKKNNCKDIFSQLKHVFTDRQTEQWVPVPSPLLHLFEQDS